MLGCPAETFFRMAISLRTMCSRPWCVRTRTEEGCKTYSEELLVQDLARVVLAGLMSAAVRLGTERKATIARPTP